MARCERARLRAQRGPRLGRNVLPLQRKLGGRPVSPESRRLGAPRTGNRNTKRKGNQPALTCKQGFHLEEPSQTEPRNTHLHPGPPVTNPLARPRPTRQGPKLVAAAAPGPTASGLGFESKPAASECPALGQGALLAGGSGGPEDSRPLLRSAWGSTGFIPAPPATLWPREGRGPGSTLGQGVRGKSP